MAYIRIKIIKDKPYAYLVENKNTSSGPRQKVKQYLGRVYELEQKEMRKVDKEVNTKEQLLLGLILFELKSFGFKKKGGDLYNENLTFSSSDFSLTKKGKNVIIKSNGGYLCSFTLQRIISFKKTKDFNKDAYTLAKYFVEAGLMVSEEEFVKFYQLI